MILVGCLRSMRRPDTSAGTSGVGTQLPFTHASLVHALPSVHVFVLSIVKTHSPFAGLHASSVHALLSLHTTGAPATQAPAEQASPAVQAFPSLQVFVLSFVKTHAPVAGLHASSVQALLSPQTTGAPGTQDPDEHVSPVVHAFPSLHAAVLLACWQPVAGLQLSSVHRLLSLHDTAAPPTQAPDEQVSPLVHAFPSSQAAVLFTYAHPVAGLQLSLVQTLLSLQVTAATPTHVPPEQVSPVVQAFPSSQTAVLFACAQPVAGLQLSSVQGLLSLQVTAVPPTHAPPEHASPVVQAFPSSQAAVLFAC